MVLHYLRYGSTKYHEVQEMVRGRVMGWAILDEGGVNRRQHMPEGKSEPVAIINVRCPYCGAAVDVSFGVGPVRCPMCNREFAPLGLRTDISEPPVVR